MDLDSPCSCDDGWLSDSYNKKYPCGCPLGDKWCKETGYMGPVTVHLPKIVPFKKPSKAFTNAFFEISDWKTTFKETAETIKSLPVSQEVVPEVTVELLPEPGHRKFKKKLE